MITIRYKSIDRVYHVLTFIPVFYIAEGENDSQLLIVLKEKSYKIMVVTLIDGWILENPVVYFVMLNRDESLMLGVVIRFKIALRGCGGRAECL